MNALPSVNFANFACEILVGGYNYESTTKLPFDCRSIPIRLQFDRATTILSYGLPVLSCCAAT